jgi:hypothetical protein
MHVDTLLKSLYRKPGPIFGDLEEPDEQVARNCSEI